MINFRGLPMVRHLGPMRTTAICVLFGFALPGRSQDRAACTPLFGGVTEGNKELVTELRARYKAQNEAITIEDSRLRKAVLADWEELQEDLIESIEHAHFIQGTAMNRLLDSTMNLLAAQLPGLSSTPRVMLSWYPWPNATTRGEGTVVMNLGMLERLTTRSELAFILGHELAHHHLDHVRRTIEQVNAKLLSKEFKSELRAVLREEFDRLAKLEALAINFSVNERRHGRNHELEADSLALRLVQAAGFDPLAGPAVMDILAACEQEVYAQQVDLVRALVQGGADPEGDWTREEETSSLGAVDLRNHELEEELKTHPECGARKLALLDLLSLPADVDAPAPDSTYLALRATVSTAILESALIEEDLGRAVFVGLHLLANGADNGEVHAGLAIAFDKLLKHARAHKLGEVLAQPHKQDSEAYQRTLKMLNRLRIRDHQALASYHLAQAQELSPGCERSLFAAVIHAANGTSAVDLVEAKKAYSDGFPKGRYIDSLAKINLPGAAKR